MSKSKQNKPRKDNLSLLLLVFCCVLLISFWFFRAKTAEAPNRFDTGEKVELKLKEEAGIPSDPTLVDIDNDFGQLENMEKEL